MSRKTKICRALLAVLGFMATGCGPKLYGPLDPDGAHGGYAPMYGVPENSYTKAGAPDASGQTKPSEVNIEKLDIEK